MNLRFRIEKCLLATGLAIIAVGCGGDGTGVTQALSGNWVQNPTDSHNTTLTISANWNVSGRSENFTLGGTDLLTGTVSSNGAFNGTIRNDQNASVQYTVKGTMKNEIDNNHLRVIYSGTLNNAPRDVDILMERAP